MFNQKNVVLNWTMLKGGLTQRHIYIENMGVVSLIAGLKIEGSIKMEGS